MKPRSASTAKPYRWAQTARWPRCSHEKIAGASQRGLAVALNGAVVPRAAWPSTTLREGDRVEIVRARQGG